MSYSEKPSKAIDLSHHLSDVSRARGLSPLKGLARYFDRPGLISLAGGEHPPCEPDGGSRRDAYALYGRRSIHRCMLQGCPARPTSLSLPFPVMVSVTCLFKSRWLCLFSHMINSTLAAALQHWYPSPSRHQPVLPRARFPGCGNCLEAPPARRKPLPSQFPSIRPTRGTSTSHRRSSMARPRACHSSGSLSTLLRRRFTNLLIRTGRHSCTRETQMGRYSRFIGSRDLLSSSRRQLPSLPPICLSATARFHATQCLSR